MAQNKTYQYKRVLLKISGESLMGSQAYGIDTDMVNRVAGEIAEVIAQGIEVCLVIGGGNIFRGVSGAATAVAIEVGICGNAHGFDEATVVEAKEKLAGGVIGTGGAHDGKKSWNELSFEPVTKVTAQVGHVVEGRDPFLVEPLNDLPRPEFWLPVGLRPPDPVVEG